MPPVGDRGLEDREHPIGGAEALGGGVEVLPDEPQRQVGLGGEEQDEEGHRIGDLPLDQPEADRHRDQGHRQRREQLEGQRGQERHPQHAHGRAAVAVADGPDRRHLRLRAAEDLERRQARHDVEEVAGQQAERAPLPVHLRLRVHADEHHEHGDERQRHRDDQRREQVLAEDREQDGDRAR